MSSIRLNSDNTRLFVEVVHCYRGLRETRTQGMCDFTADDNNYKPMPF